VTAQDSEPRELEVFQGYLDPAPMGMDVRYAWTLPGGRGENVRIVDIEFNWNLNHNDLVAATSNLFVYVKGVDPLPEVNLNHGAAVLGEIVAAPDGIGVTGIAHKAKLGLINPNNGNNNPKVADAINKALQHLEPGDVILLEQQSFNGPRLDPSNGRGLLPIEFDTGVFGAIKEATRRGIVVIEPAGNGFENLDDSIYKGLFDRRKKDSGAIMVGSANPPEGIYGPGPDRVRTPESNYGSRVDVQGWGRQVTTCGYGDLRHEQGQNNWYTIDFGGTSSAAAMVAGAVALLQSIIKERGQAPLTPAQVRQLLIATGTPNAGPASQNIGPRPNLRAAIEAWESGDLAPKPSISVIKYKKSKGQLTIDGSNFTKGDSIIEIDGTAVTKLKYPAAFVGADNIASRVITKQNVNSLLPAGVDVSITIFTPSSGKRSEPFTFRSE
jgi:subtilisin family serine protease